MSSVSKPVVVGVDGSIAARCDGLGCRRGARSWRAAAPGLGDRRQTPRCRAEDALRVARGAVETQALTVQVDEVVRSGSKVQVLLKESSAAAMICLGTSHRIGAMLGVTAIPVTQGAQSTVAIIRAEGNSGAWRGGTITVVLDYEPGNDTIVRQAMMEGRLRHATVRQVDRRVNSWVRRVRDVHVEVVAAGTGRSASQSGDHDLAQLAVIGHAEAGRLAVLVNPNCTGVSDIQIVHCFCCTTPSPTTAQRLVP